MKGNITDLAIALIIGVAFGKVITSLVDNILMPVIGSFIGKSFADLSTMINGVVTKYGQIRNIAFQSKLSKFLYKSRNC